MRKLVTRITVVAALAAFAVPTLACDMMKSTQASTQEKVEQKKQQPQAKSEKKADPKAQADKTKVATADKK